MRENSLEVSVGNRIIGPSHPCFVIAEVGNNHNGDFKRALQMVDLAKEMGADCVKFQMRHMSAVYRKKSLQKVSDDLSSEYVLDLLARFELSVDQHRQVSEYCQKIGILYLCTPWDPTSIKVLESFNVKAYKVASADFTNLPLIERLIQTGKTLFLSTGMTHEEEIIQVTKYLNERKAKFVLLHCNSTYPAPYRNLNLSYIHRLKSLHPLVGYSGHERGITACLGARALGTYVLEKHFTLDRNMEGPDHAASLEFEEFQKLIQELRLLEEALGEETLGVNTKKVIGQGELMNRETLGKSLVAKVPLKAGHIIRPEDIDVLAPGQGLSPLRMTELVGKKIQRDMAEEDFFFASDLSDVQSHRKTFKFKRPWGVPVRYHDFNRYMELFKGDLVEFHLSYSDMELKISDFLKGSYDIGFVVHAPELFKDSHLMDLATPDEEYRKNSVKETQRVINVTRELKAYFPKTPRPMIVANIGGISRDANLSEQDKQSRYKIFAQSLKELDLEGVELIPQTMAPFPWHFGGQRFQNIFVHAEESAMFCKEHNLRMCLDVSHSQLTSNFFGKDLVDFIRILGPYVGHLHLGDATGVDGEGLQIGEGTMEMERVCKALNEHAPNASFIPEIWQGHKNDGQGFRVALEKLEVLL